jgi:hypothetical protein
MVENPDKPDMQPRMQRGIPLFLYLSAFPLAEAYQVYQTGHFAKMRKLHSSSRRTATPPGCARFERGGTEGPPPTATHLHGISCPRICASKFVAAAGNQQSDTFTKLAFTALPVVN